MARLAAIVGLAILLGGCPSIGAGRALDEAEEALAAAAPANVPTAPDRARYEWFMAKAFVAEAHARAGHGDWSEAEAWAKKARKAAEAALRRVTGDSE